MTNKIEAIFAFPLPLGTGDRPDPAFGGMLLRDYFAAKIIQGLAGALNNDRGRVPSSKELAELSYSVADAMLEEREANNDAK